MGEKLVTYKHGVTRFRITLDCFAAEHEVTARSRSKQTNGRAAEIRWVKLTELDNYALPVTGRKLAKLISR